MSYKQLSTELRTARENSILNPIKWQPERGEHDSIEPRSFLTALIALSLIALYNHSVEAAEATTEQLLKNPSARLQRRLERQVSAARKLLGTLDAVVNTFYHSTPTEYHQNPAARIGGAALTGIAAVILPVFEAKSCNDSEPSAIVVEMDTSDLEEFPTPAPQPTIPAFAAPAPATGVPPTPEAETTVPIEEPVVEVETPSVEEWLENYAIEHATPTPEGSATPDIKTDTQHITPELLVTRVIENGIITVVVVATPSPDSPETMNPEVELYTLESAIEYAEANNIAIPTALVVEGPSVVEGSVQTDAVFVYAVDAAGIIVLEVIKTPTASVWSPAEPIAPETPEAPAVDETQEQVEAFNTFVEGILENAEEIPMFGETENANTPISFHLIQSPLTTYETEGFYVNEEVSQEQLKQHYENILARSGSDEYKAIVQAQLDDLIANGIEQHVQKILTQTLFGILQSDVAEFGAYTVQYDASSPLSTVMPKKHIPAGDVSLSSLRVVLNLSGVPMFTDMTNNGGTTASVLLEPNTGQAVIEIRFVESFLSLLAEHDSPGIALILPTIISKMFANPENLQKVTEAGGWHGDVADIDPDWAEINNLVRVVTSAVIDGVEYNNISVPLFGLKLTPQQ